jgi:hypothetical protein
MWPAQEQLAKVFRCVAEGKPIALPAPPPEALWQPAIRTRRQPGDDNPAAKASPAKPAAAAAPRPTLHAAADAGSAPKHRQGASGGRKYTGFSPAALAELLPAPPVPGAGASRARSAVRDNRGAKARRADDGNGGAPDGTAAVPMQMSWHPQLQHQVGLSFGAGRGPGDLALGSSLLNSSLMLWPQASFFHGVGAPMPGLPAGGGGGGGSQLDLSSMFRLFVHSQGRDPANLHEMTNFLMSGGMPQAEEVSTGALLPGRPQPPASQAPAAPPAPSPLPAASPGGAPMAAALATAAAAKTAAAAGDGVDRVPGRVSPAGEGMRPPVELSLTHRVTTSARELASLLRQLRDAAAQKPPPDLGPGTKAGAALNDVHDLLWQQGFRGTSEHPPEHPLEALAAPTIPYAPGH